ncbi:CBS domain-containing protein [Halorubrum ezzemoulense]|jgi:CBS domain-containing protein|uniref:CBS domain-containing protein n=1 Tax=Halorubrum ezzemoulense TaxID=337243 RepID=A0A256K623_HALEZ|nr:MULTISPECIES: CBS domain-containing protein [Halorubrum]MDB2236625.1 CBS domain-containing protein [Halorubrum ezzemoulense]MDB2241019.1 CBS domain-containing protein [Halorubrum ezzemoulense]MDB2244717.1 CBS domain-containing protein [Halorubrum ezzemoulense]MDB2248087.1 CBS domain-containing protein [Halorubrum ezzemoulense]MDB2250924.1 CBS domain-containing protein [Halorubrum ezzemoulense]
MDLDDRTRVADVMSTPLETIGADAPLREAARRMRDENISALVVTTGGGCILTQSDVVGAVADGSDPEATTVRDVMTEDVETVTPDLMLEEVAAMMTMYGVKHLPVVDDDYVGMMSSTDIAAHIS